MRGQRRPKIGCLGIMTDVYDKRQPSVTRDQEEFARRIVASLRDIADVTFVRACKNRAEIESVTQQFNDEAYDGLMIVMLLYSPGLRLVRALERNRLPILLANVQPLPSVTPDWNWGHLTTNQGIHGAQETANVMYRMGIRPCIVTEKWQDEAFREVFRDWALAAMTASSLKTMRIAAVGKMLDMSDILADEAAYFRKIGPLIIQENLGDVFRRMELLSKEEVTHQLDEDRANFEIDRSLPAKTHEYAATLQLGIEGLLEAGAYDGFTMNFTAFGGDGRFKQLPLLGASNLMAKGYGYAAEGDTSTAALGAAGNVLIGDSHFTEMYSLDYEKESALMSHMGEGNWKIARQDRPIRLIDRVLEIGNLENPPTLIFSARPGAATLVSFVAIEGERFRLVVSKGEVLDTEELRKVPMPYFHFRPETGLRKCIDSWLELGGTHHQILNLGDHVRRWEMLSKMLGIDCQRV
ncbi:MAG TPA: L-fucose/L-arabinose isomerase family protein [Anaeromyxobacteraceae bacterium]|nr:L-fucose/L-arabinose isomerase family protein [Anaeromyxobacteraceae bacterium]